MDSDVLFHSDSHINKKLFNSSRLITREYNLLFFRPIILILIFSFIFIFFINLILFSNMSVTFEVLELLSINTFLQNFTIFFKSNSSPIPLIVVIHFLPLVWILEMWTRFWSKLSNYYYPSKSSKLTIKLKFTLINIIFLSLMNLCLYNSYFLHIFNNSNIW